MFSRGVVQSIAVQYLPSGNSPKSTSDTRFHSPARRRTRCGWSTCIEQLVLLSRQPPSFQVVPHALQGMGRS
jgi:hypothetical protein